MACLVRGRRRLLALFLETGSAQDRPALSWLKRDGRLRAALRTCRACLGTYPLASSGAPRLALLAVFGIVLELLIVKKDLLACCKHELRAAVDTYERAIVEFHGRLPPQGRAPKSAMFSSSSPVPVPCIRSSCLTRARTAPRILRCRTLPGLPGQPSSGTPSCTRHSLANLQFLGNF
jgi:hypothetical protein